MDDLISRHAALLSLDYMYCETDEDGHDWILKGDAGSRLEALPSAQPNPSQCWGCNCQKMDAQPTLCGYKVELLAYIARVMQKEGVSAEYAVRTFDDMSRALKMIIEEANEKVTEYLEGMYGKNDG